MKLCINPRILGATASRHFFSSIAVLLTLLSLSACALGGSGSRSMSTMPTASVAPPTSTPALPASIPADPGWHVVLQLGYVSPGVTTSGSTFNVSNPFRLIVVCEGAGTLDVEYPPIGSSTVTCGIEQQLDQQQINVPQGSLTSDTVHATVTASDGVVWRAIIEEPN